MNDKRMTTKLFFYYCHPTTIPGGHGRQKLNKKGSVGKKWKLLPKGIENKIK
jgi:hypothetical protein